MAHNESNLAPPLPHSKEAEVAFLGAILLGSGGPAEIQLLQSGDFFLREHQTIHRHLKKLAEAGSPTNDLVLLYESIRAGDSLQATSDLDAAGGADYIARLCDGLPRTSNVAHYAEIIKDKAEVRSRIYKYRTQADRLHSANGNAGLLLAEDTKEFVSYLTPRVEVETKGMRFKSASDTPTYDRTEWIAKALVPKGAIASINAKIKLGKTAFVLSLCRAALDGLDFLGQPTTKTHVVYLTEQPASSFDRAINLADLRGRDGFLYLPFTETCGMEWPAVAARVAMVCKESKAGLLVIDTLSQFAGIAGDSENDAGAALAAMLPLQKIAADGVGVVIVRHARKSGGDVEDAGRGSSAFDGAADIILSLRKPEGSQPENRRLLNSSGRYGGETHNNLLIELTDAGYIAIGSQQETVINDAKETILAMVPHSELEAVSIADLAESTKIAKVTVHRACDELCRTGKLCRSGKGKKGSPFLYWKEEIRFVSTSTIEVEHETNREPGEDL